MSKTNNAFWNGSEPVTFEVVTYKVLEPDIKTWWPVCFVGAIRQGIIITYAEGYGFLIDNQAGDGYLKLIRSGKGIGTCKNVEPGCYELIEREVDPFRWIVDINTALIHSEYKIYSEYLQQNHPQHWARVQMLIDHKPKPVRRRREMPQDVKDLHNQIKFSIALITFIVVWVVVKNIFKLEINF